MASVWVLVILVISVFTSSICGKGGVFHCGRTDGLQSCLYDYRTRILAESHIEIFLLMVCIVGLCNEFPCDGVVFGAEKIARCFIEPVLQSAL